MAETKHHNPHLQVRPVLIGWAVIVVLFTAVLFFVIGLNYGQDNPHTVETVITDSESIETPPVPRDPSESGVVDANGSPVVPELSMVAE